MSGWEATVRWLEGCRSRGKKGGREEPRECLSRKEQPQASSQTNKVNSVSGVCGSLNTSSHTPSCLPGLSCIRIIKCQGCCQ